MVLEYAASQKLQFGRDIVFTYGPLGYLNGSVGHGLLIPQRIAFALAWSGIIAWSVICLAKTMSKPAKYVFLLWILVFYNDSLFRIEQHAFLVMAWGYLVLTGDVARHKRAVLAFLTAFACLALVKFTFFLAAVATVAVCCSLQLGRRNVTGAAALAGVFGAVFLALWFACGQQLQNIWPWIRNSMEITAGYTEAMTDPPKQSVFLISLVAISLFLAAVAIRALSLRRTMANLGFLLVTVLFAFLSWKQGFVRADGHVLYFIFFLPIAAALLLTEAAGDPMSGRGRRTLVPLLCLIVLLCALAANYQEKDKIRNTLVGFPGRLQQNARLILDAADGDSTGRYRQLRLTSQSDPEMNLTRLGAIIGNATVDVISYRQTAALANGLNYQPRPVFQSYAAYTPYLQELNLAYLRSERRPEFVIFRLETIDHRLPTMDDAPLISHLFMNYDRVWKDDSIILFKSRGTGTRNLHLTKVSEQAIPFGKRLSLAEWGDSVIFMRVDVKPTVIGRLIKFIYRAPLITLYADIGGKTKAFRFIPAMTKHGFIINPSLQDNEDVAEFFQKRSIFIDSIMFSQSNSFWGKDADSLTVQLFKAE